MEIKICKKCNIEKGLHEYKKYTGKLCIDCNKIVNKERNKKYYSNNSEKILSRNHSYIKEWRENNKEKLDIYYQNNKEKISDEKKTYRKNNKDKIKKWFSDNRYKINEYRRNKYNNDPLYKLTIGIRNYVKSSFVKNEYIKKTNTSDILGCSYEELKIYLESLFESWMTWENHGLYNGELQYGWDIDHIIPLSNATTEEELIKLCHYTNLQPLCSYINRVIKRDNI